MNVLLIMPLLFASGPEVDTEHRSTVVVVLGASGTAEYESEFLAWTERWKESCSKASAQMTLIGRKADDQSTEVSDHTALQSLLAAEPKDSPAPLWLILIGHGTYDGRLAKFNLDGPDVSALEIRDWLEPFERPVAVINCASSSGPFINRLSRPGRIVITATKSGSEQNYARFGDYLSRSLLDLEADIDRDGQVSLLEACLSASRTTEEYYQSQGRLASEHALLDDNGDGLGTPADWFRGVRAVRKSEGKASTDGPRAHQLHLIPSPRELKIPLEQRRVRDELELDVVRLRELKETIPPEDYEKKLEEKLLKLARFYESLGE